MGQKFLWLMIRERGNQFCQSPSHHAKIKYLREASIFIIFFACLRVPVELRDVIGTNCNLESEIFKDHMILMKCTDLYSLHLVKAAAIQIQISCSFPPHFVVKMRELLLLLLILISVKPFIAFFQKSNSHYKFSCLNHFDTAFKKKTLEINKK